MLDLTAPAEMLLSRANDRRAHALLVGVSGIDGSGKGYVTERLAARLREREPRVAVLNIDGWLEPPSRRFSKADPGRHFYEHGIRFGELFSRLLLPLKRDRSIRLEADLTDPTGAEAFRRHEYRFDDDVAVVLVEGVFLFKRSHRAAFDLAFWVECGFDTALRRALARAQEGLPPEETVRDYQTIYFPAQRLHFEIDDPAGFATAVIDNES
jgi:uridine kinase